MSIEDRRDGSAAGDDEMFARGMAVACAAWTAVLVANLPKVLDTDRPRGPATFRQRMLTALEAFADTADELTQLPALAATARHMHDTLRDRWGPQVKTIECFPAF